MIIVDSNVWIDHFAGNRNRQTTSLARFIQDGRDIVIGEIIFFEVLCGYRDERDYRGVRFELETFRRVSMTSAERVDAALDRHRLLRAQGFTATMADMLIGSFCVSQNAALLTRDSGFLAMRRVIGLQLVDAHPTA